MDWTPQFNDVGATASGHARPGRERRHPDRGRAQLRPHRPQRVGPDRAHRLQDEPHPRRRGQPGPDRGRCLFYTDAQTWPARLYQKFSDPYAPARFDSALAANYNIGFLFASGPFTLLAGQHERFSLALAFGADLNELKSTVATVQQIYNANYQFAVPPPMPTLAAEAGDGFVACRGTTWRSAAWTPSPVLNDFEGYRIYRSTDPEFRDPQILTTGQGADIGLKKPTRIFDLADGRRGYSQKAVEGIQYYLGDDAGVTHTWTDFDVTNGQVYYYAVTAFDFGVDSPFDSLRVFPSENAITVTQTPRGGLILPKNAVEVRPNPRTLGLQDAAAGTPAHVAGDGVGGVDVRVVNDNLVPEGHRFRLEFKAPPDSVRANEYALIDSTTRDTCFKHGNDFGAAGDGSVGCGLLPLVTRRSGRGPGRTAPGFLRAGGPLRPPRAA
jgi:hypothetical protein